MRACIPDSALVLDVGGGAKPLERADWVIDAIPWEKRGGSRREERFSRETWVTRDICSREPWPFGEKMFDFAVCSHVLEDARDPVWICSEMSRVARAGCIVTPSRYVEQSLGVEHPCYAGYYHHRWLIELTDGQLLFRHKPHLLHSLPGAIVARLGAFREIAPHLAILKLEWRDAIIAREALEFDEAAVKEELCLFAQRARNEQNLTVRRNEPVSHSFRRWFYYLKLRSVKP